MKFLITNDLQQRWLVHVANFMSQFGLQFRVAHSTHRSAPPRPQFWSFLFAPSKTPSWRFVQTSHGICEPISGRRIFFIPRPGSSRITCPPGTWTWNGPEGQELRPELPIIASWSIKRRYTVTLALPRQSHEGKREGMKNVVVGTRCPASRAGPAERETSRCPTLRHLETPVPAAGLLEHRQKEERPLGTWKACFSGLLLTELELGRIKTAT